MIFKPSAFVAVVVAAVVGTQAATSASSSASAAAATPSGLTPCIITCSSNAASSTGCSSYTDLACVCTSTAFQSAAAACLVANCTAADVSSAQQIQQVECASFSNSTSSVSSSASHSSSGSGSTSTSTSAATSSGAALGLVPSFALDNVFGGLVALAGVFIGVAVVI